MVAVEIVVTMATERVINTSQYKLAAMSYLSYFKAKKTKVWYKDESSPR